MHWKKCSAYRCCASIVATSKKLDLEEVARRALPQGFAYIIKQVGHRIRSMIAADDYCLKIEQTVRTGDCEGKCIYASSIPFAPSGIGLLYPGGHPACRCMVEKKLARIGY